ncbi:MAG TPA: sugar transferase [Steroidobacteraceae bacterium]|nr:sugar transferase [Steroidobacteraceae bacterium]
MSTQPANEAAPQRLATNPPRRPPLRPHLVSGGDRRMSFDSDGQAESSVALDGAAVALHSLEQCSWEEARTQTPAQPALPAASYGATKRVLDVVGSIVLAAVFSPLIVVIVALMHRREGSVIYRHRRVGRHGQTFECLKFRTMVPNAEQVLRELLERDPEIKAEWLRDHKLRCDPRVTRLGRFLRRTSLDELPQLWNVIRGEMSLVGPRPVVREELLRYGRNVGAYLSAKPGITGLWQVKGRNDTDYRRRVVMDTYYVKNQNLQLDLYILLQTTRVVLGGSGAY